jgi:hypothetical protein
MTIWTWTELALVLSIVLVFLVVVELVAWWWVGRAPEDR